MKIRSVWIGSVLSILLSAASASPIAQASREPPPGEGVICAWAIYSLVEEVGRRCAPESYPEAQAELRRAVQRLDEYVRANSDFTPEQVAQFKSEQAHVGAPEAQLCQGDGLEMFEHIAEIDPLELSTGIDALVAHPGAPTWGTCL